MTIAIQVLVKVIEVDLVVVVQWVVLMGGHVEDQHHMLTVDLENMVDVPVAIVNQVNHHQEMVVVDVVPTLVVLEEVIILMVKMVLDIVVVYREVEVGIMD